MLLNILLYLFFGVLLVNAVILFFVILMEFYKNAILFFKSVRRKNKDDIIKYYGISTGFFLGMILMSFVIYAIATPLLNAFQ